VSILQRRVCSALAVVALGASPVGAEEQPTTRNRGELFLKVSTGVGLSRDSDLKIRQGAGTRLTFSDVPWEDNSLSGPSARYVSVRIGYFLKSKPWLGVAGEFLHFKIFGEVDRVARVRGTNEGVPIDALLPISDIVQRYEVTNGVNFLPVSFIARYRGRRGEKFPDGRVRPYGGVGVGPTLLYTRSTVNGSIRSGPYEWGNPGFMAIAGLELMASRHWDVFTEYKFTYTEVNGQVSGGSSSSEIYSNHFTLGVGVHF
jgi:hypothetical protein